MKITIHNSQKVLTLPTHSIKKWVRFLLKEYGSDKNWDELILHFVDKKTISDIHEQFFQDPTPTDCISFPFPPPSKLLGEVFVCPEVALEYAKKKQKDPYKETALYIIHGLLHLLGYDDIETSERRKMRKEERRCLASYEQFFC